MGLARVAQRPDDIALVAGRHRDGEDALGLCLCRDRGSRRHRALWPRWHSRLAASVAPPRPPPPPPPSAGSGATIGKDVGCRPSYSFGTMKLSGPSGISTSLTCSDWSSRTKADRAVRIRVPAVEEGRDPVPFVRQRNERPRKLRVQPWRADEHGNHETADDRSSEHLMPPRVTASHKRKSLSTLERLFQLAPDVPLQTYCCGLSVVVSSPSGGSPDRRGSACSPRRPGA